MSSPLRFGPGRVFAIDVDPSEADGVILGPDGAELAVELGEVTEVDMELDQEGEG